MSPGSNLMKPFKKKNPVVSFCDNGASLVDEIVEENLKVLESCFDCLGLVIGSLRFRDLNHIALRCTLAG